MLLRAFCVEAPGGLCPWPCGRAEVEVCAYDYPDLLKGRPFVAVGPPGGAPGPWAAVLIWEPHERRFTSAGFDGGAPVAAHDLSVDDGTGLVPFMTWLIDEHLAHLLPQVTA